MKLPGFTIMELVVAGALATIIGVVAVYTVIEGNQIFGLINRGQQRTSDIGKTVNQEIYRPVRLARTFLENIEIDGQTYEAQPKNPNAEAKTIIVELTSISNAQGKPKCDGTTDIIVFDEASDGIHRIIKADAGSFRQSGDILLMPEAMLRVVQDEAGGAHREVDITVTVPQPNRTIEYTETMVARND